MWLPLIQSSSLHRAERTKSFLVFFLLLVLLVCRVQWQLNWQLVGVAEKSCLPLQLKLCWWSKIGRSEHNVTAETVKCLREGAGPGAEEEGENMSLSHFNSSCVSLLERRMIVKLNIQGILEFLSSVNWMNVWWRKKKKNCWTVKISII